MPPKKSVRISSRNKDTTNPLDAVLALGKQLVEHQNIHEKTDSSDISKRKRSPSPQDGTDSQDTHSSKSMKSDPPRDNTGFSYLKPIGPLNAQEAMDRELLLAPGSEEHDDAVYPKDLPVIEPMETLVSGYMESLSIQQDQLALITPSYDSQSDVNIGVKTTEMWNKEFGHGYTVSQEVIDYFLKRQTNPPMDLNRQLEVWFHDKWDHLVDPPSKLSWKIFMFCVPRELTNRQWLDLQQIVCNNLEVAKIRAKKMDATFIRTKEDLYDLIPFPRQGGLKEPARQETGEWPVIQQLQEMTREISEGFGVVRDTVTKFSSMSSNLAVDLLRPFVLLPRTQLPNWKKLLGKSRSNMHHCLKYQDNDHCPCHKCLTLLPDQHLFSL